MARFLISGFSAQISALRDRLERAGHDVTWMDATVRPARCDAALHVGRRDCAANCPVLLPGGGRIPNVLIGDAPQDCPLRTTAEAHVRDIVAVPDALAEILSRALPGAPGDTAVAGRSPRGEIDFDGYAEFVGHELRTPLTVLRTAVEALAEMSGSTAASSVALPDERRRQLLEATRRNLRRLERTITWNEDFLRAIATPSHGPTAPWSLRSLIDEPIREAGDELGDVRVVLPPAPRRVVADGEAVRSLVRQLLRACRYHLHEAPLLVAAAPWTDTEGFLGLQLRVNRVESDATGRDQAPLRPPLRSGLLPSAARDGSAEFRLELTQLLRFSIPQTLIDRLGAVIRLGGRAPNAVMVTATLPVVRAVATGPEEASNETDRALVGSPVADDS